MSAYVCDVETINRIVTWVEDHERTWIRGLADLGVTNEPGYDLHGKLLALNVAAVNYRYDANDPPPNYTYRRQPGTDIEVYKSMQGWQYQCTEGEQFQKDPLFLLVSEMMAYLAYEIIAKLPAYNKADWA